MLPPGVSKLVDAELSGTSTAPRKLNSALGLTLGRYSSRITPE